MPPTKTWKDVENKVAQLSGGERIKGNRGDEVEDVSHPYFSFEVKHRQKLPALVVKAYDQAKRNAPKGKVPVVVLHGHSSQDYMAVLPLAELARLAREGLDGLALLRD